MARKHMAPPEASRSRSLRPLATTVPRRTEHPTKLAASVCPHRRHLNPSPRHRSSQGAKLQERSNGSWQRAMAWLLSHPRSGTARKDPKANAAMESPEQRPLRSRASSITRTLTFCNPRQESPEQSEEISKKESDCPTSSTRPNGLTRLTIRNAHRSESRTPS